MPENLSIISKAIKTLKKLQEVTKKIKDADTLTLIADLNMSLADLKLQFADIQEENLGLKTKLKEILINTSYREKLEHRDYCYYFKEPEPNYSDGPYCTRCFDADQKLILVTPLPRDMIFAGKYTCPNCKAKY